MSEITKYPALNDFTFKGSFLPTIKGPVDVRTLVQNYASLKAAFAGKTEGTTDLDKVADAFLYEGLVITSVEENTQYICIDPTKAGTNSGWKKIVGGLHKVAYGTCSTAADVAEKVVTLHEDFADWKLEVGAEVIFKADYQNKAPNPTLNINNTGARSIKYAGTVMTTQNLSVATAPREMRYMYDGTNYVWIGWSLDNDTAIPKSLGFGYAICETDANTTAKLATLTSYSAKAHGIVSVKFTNSVPANSTLNINNQGTKPIHYRGSAIVAGVINAGDVVTFIYDGTNYIYLGTDNALSRAGGKITGNLVIADDTDDVVEIDAQGITLHDTSDEEGTQPRTTITHNTVESGMFKVVNGTSDEILLADGTVASIMKSDDIENAIATAWGS